MERFVNVNVISAILIFIPSIHLAHLDLRTTDGDLSFIKRHNARNLLSTNEMGVTHTNNETLQRVKRQDTRGKYEDAAQMGNMKLIQICVQMFRNMFIQKTVGGTNPWHHTVPGPAVKFLREKIGGILVKQKSNTQESLEDTDNN